jgi:hypothetical protein
VLLRVAIGGGVGAGIGLGFHPAALLYGAVKEDRTVGIRCEKDPTAGKF